MTGQTIIAVTLVRVILDDCDPYAAPQRIPVRTLYFSGRDYAAAERAWLLDSLDRVFAVAVA